MFEISGASMFESMWSSMTSSMQLAEDCLKNEKEGLSEDNNPTFEGIERFAQTIDSSRFLNISELFIS